MGNDPAVPPTGRPAERRLAAVERALRVLDAFLRVRGDAGTSELARLTGINASTVSRTLSTLVDAGYVEHVPTPAATASARTCSRSANHVVARLDLRVLGRAHLEQLERELAKRRRSRCRRSPTRSRSTSSPVTPACRRWRRIGRASVAHATATGKVMLAFGPEHRRAARAVHRAHGGRARTRFGARSRPCARSGWARAAGEREQHLNAIAAPVFGARGELAAIVGVQGPDTRFEPPLRTPPRRSRARSGAVPSARISWPTVWKKLCLSGNKEESNGPAP